MSFDSFEQEWRDRFAGAKVPPDSAVWQRLSGTLAAQQAQRRRRRILLWWWSGAGAVLLLGLSLWAIQGDLLPASLTEPAKKPSTVWASSKTPFPEGARTGHVHEKTQPSGPENLLPASVAPLNQTQAHIETKSSAGHNVIHTSQTVTVTVTEGSPGYQVPMVGGALDNALVLRGLVSKDEMKQKFPVSVEQQTANLLSSQPVDLRPYHWEQKILVETVTAMPVEALKPRRWQWRVGIQGYYESPRPWPGASHRGVDARTESFSLLTTPQDTTGIYQMQFANAGAGIRGGVSYRLRPQWSIGMGIEGTVSSRSTYSRSLAVIPSNGPSIIDQYVGPVEDALVDGSEQSEQWRVWQVGVPIQLLWHPAGPNHGWQLGASTGMTYTRNPVQRSDINSPAYVDAEELDARRIYTRLNQNYLQVNSWHAWGEGEVNYAWRMGNGQQVKVGTFVRHFLTAPYLGLAAPSQMRYRVGLRASIGLNP